MYRETTTTKKIIACLLIYSQLLMGCVANSMDNGAVKTGPGPEYTYGYKTTQHENAVAAIDTAGPKLEVIVPVFDPGLDDKAKNYEKEGIWPELRRAEANRFAWKLKQALDSTGAFGAVRVTPSNKITGDLYVMGKIEASDGEDVKFNLDVVDISGHRWMDKHFSHTVKKGFYNDYRKRGTDPYDPIFKEAAAAIIKVLKEKGDTDLNTLKQIAQLRFGSSLNPSAFTEYMAVDRGYYKVASLPSDNDPMLERVNAIRVRDQLFIDNLQQSYAGFSQNMEDSYLRWQEAGFNEKQLHRKAKTKGVLKAIGGALLLGLSIAAAASNRNNSQNATIGHVATDTAAIAGGLAGAWMLSGSFKSFEEAKFHKESINELGESVNIEMAPQVVSFEKETVELTGNVQEQYDQWRAFLKRIYEQEATPATTL